MSKIINTPIATSVSTTDNVMINQGNSLKQIPIQKIVDLDSDASLSSAKGAILPFEMDNIFIMYHRKSDNFPLMVKTEDWTALQSSGEVAEGVVLVDGTKCLVIAPTEATTTLKWSSAAISGSGTTTTDRVAAICDWAGKANTAAQIAASTSSAVTNTSSYAPGFCNLYSKTNANGYGLTAGKWWLPSMGEMMAIYANMLKINYALNLISGATQLVEDWYWTSTEYSATTAWFLYLNYGYLGNSTKATTAGHVRPVSAFIA